jgi:uncharacterized membrane protein
MLHNHQEHDNNSNHNNITTSRLEAFSDGVMAIIITITVLELKVPHGTSWADILPLVPLFIAYLISFQMVGTYWNNHHHLLKATDHVSAGMMWANLHLLFWLSLIPFSTGWLGENHGGEIPTALYSAILLMCAIAYSILLRTVVAHAKNRHELIAELNKSKKGTISLIAYAAAVPLAFLSPIISDVLIIFVAIIWFVPDRRIEKYI